MNFECKTVTIASPMLNANGVMEPLCNTCTQVDCSNPIRRKTVSLFGKNVEWEVFMAGDGAYQVVTCLGYTE